MQLVTPANDQTTDEFRGRIILTFKQKLKFTNYVIYSFLGNSPASEF